MSQKWYVRGESRFSDHRPVSSLFTVQLHPRRSHHHHHLQKEAKYQQQLGDLDHQTSSNPNPNPNEELLQQQQICCSDQSARFWLEVKELILFFWFFGVQFESFKKMEEMKWILACLGSKCTKVFYCLEDTLLSHSLIC